MITVENASLIKSRALRNSPYVRYSKESMQTDRPCDGNSVGKSQ
jgi:hypothetical protein